MTWGYLVLITLTACRLTRLVTRDDITAPVRAWVVRRYPPHAEPVLDALSRPVAGSARNVPSWPAVFVHCDWCVGVWTSLGAVVVGHFVGLVPRWQVVGFAWLAISMVVGSLSRMEA